eukprot:TRINITY_DN30366_c0_g6_i1.p1 TRINITY_DN30366_c0_g6~~TRINITY_DN30366_c0_g6_i1.p1  ORF type:complete len:418 (+),score=49.06 TRINITY_DN30366_c0_g6_i1:234-1487(+)
MKRKSDEAPENAELQFAKAASTVTRRGSTPKKDFRTQSDEQVAKPCRGLVKTLMHWVKNFVADVFHGRLESLTQIVKSNLRTRRPGLKGFLGSFWKTLVDLLYAPKVQSALLGIRDAIKHEVLQCKFGKKADAAKINVNGSSLLAVEGVASFETIPEKAKMRDGIDARGGTQMQNTPSFPPRTDLISTMVPKAMVPKAMVKWLVNRKWKMALVCMFMDLLGILFKNVLPLLVFLPFPVNFAMFFLLPLLRLPWVLVSAVWLKDMYNGSSRLFFISIIEEVFTYFGTLPTHSIAWLFSYKRGGSTFDAVRLMLDLPDRSRVGSKSCSEETLQSMKAKYEIVKDNEAGHVYLRCKSRRFFRRRKQKASCVKEECGGNAGYCFVKNRCGGVRAGACIALKEQNPLKCAEGRTRPQEGIKQ